MKTALNGVRYDTDTASEIGQAVQSSLRPTGHWWVATLYMTPRSGRFFLFGGGGFMSRFKGKEKVFVELTNDEMLAWVKNYLPKKTLTNNPDLTAIKIKEKGGK